MDLPTIWFIIVGYLFAGFFFLEGFDYGVGMLLPLVSRNDEHRRMMIASIGGVWDGNEVWMITAGAVLFASFPAWYATLFSSLYFIFVFILLGLIIRGVGIKFRSQREDAGWRYGWDVAIALGSLLAAFLWGMVVGNLLTGIPIDGDMAFVGSFSDLVSPFVLLTALAVVLLFLLHGAVYLNIKLTGDALKALRSLLCPIYLTALITAALFLAAGFYKVALVGTLPEMFLAGGAVVALAGCGVALLQKRDLLAFWLSGVTIVSVTALVFTHMFPNVLISTVHPLFNITVQKASSSPYALKVMSVVALLFIPMVVLYQGWTYWILRKRIERSDLHY